jgi:hypothetical protein
MAAIFAEGATAWRLLLRVDRRADDLEATISSEHRGNVHCIVIDNPTKKNALDRDQIVALTDAIAEPGADPDTRVIVLRGAARFSCLQEGQSILGPSLVATLQSWAIVHSRALTQEARSYAASVPETANRLCAHSADLSGS